MSSAAIKLEVPYQVKKVLKYFKGRKSREKNLSRAKKIVKYGKSTY